MQAAMVVTWKNPFPGREAKAMEYGAEVQEYWSQQANADKCSQPEMFFGSSGTGMWMVKGELAILLEVTQSDTSKRLLATGSLLLDGFGYEWMLTGPAADDYMATYATVAGQLGLT